MAGPALIDVGTSAVPTIPAATAWYAVTILCLALLVSFTDRLVINLVVDPIRADLSLTDCLTRRRTMSVLNDTAPVETPAHSIGKDSASNETLPISRAGRRRLPLFALALGTFCIGTTEFASMGIIQLFSASLEVDIPTATHAITAYAIGVVFGAPALTLAAARLNRRALLLVLIVLFILGNLLSALAGSLELFIAARFLTGLPQGAYFGAGAVGASYIVGPGHAGRAFASVMAGLTVATIVGSPLATLLGQTIGWRETYPLHCGAGSCLAAVNLALRSPHPRTRRRLDRP